MTTTLPSDFDAATYLKLNPDVMSSGVDPSQHYLDYGMSENRPYKKDEAGLESALAEFSPDEPLDENAFNLFSGSWSTIYESPDGKNLTNGTFAGTVDSRIDWLAEKLDLTGANILELGPLEAAHTLMLEERGATMLGVEANVGAFLRCLVIKNQYDLKSKFLLGDFTKIDTGDQKFDLVLASGVLYHMADPVKFLEKFSKCADRMYLWTHYFDADLTKWNPALQEPLAKGKWNHKEPDIVMYDDLSIQIVKQQYGESLGWSGFCGGPDEYSYWVAKDDLLALLEKLGYTKIEVSFDDVGHQNGPSFCVYAEK